MQGKQAINSIRYPTAPFLRSIETTNELILTIVHIAA